ncbi:MAG: GtrA family protein [Thermoanaerobaculum sp.]|nr:GtrA family protein [Thermoanaerobaculum sp.]MDW7967652.1 GtrA family protein [Thermoanaerobaculum sp.]
MSESISAGDRAEVPFLARLFRHSLVRFCLVGIASAAVDVAVTAFFLHLGVHYNLAASLGLTASVIANFLGHARFTFPGKYFWPATLARYLVVLLANYGITVAVMTLGVEHFAVHPLLAKVVAVVVVAVHGYTWSKLWIFRISSEA